MPVHETDDKRHVKKKKKDTDVQFLVVELRFVFFKPSKALFSLFILQFEDVKTAKK